MSSVQMKMKINGFFFTLKRQLMLGDFVLVVMDGRMDGWMDGQMTDRQTDR